MNHRETPVVLLISERLDLRDDKMSRIRERHDGAIKGQVHPEDNSSFKTKGKRM